jgi:hypothetical protein
MRVVAPCVDEGGTIALDSVFGYPKRHGADSVFQVQRNCRPHVAE